jgi:hypothetical protein
MKTSDTWDKVGDREVILSFAQKIVATPPRQVRLFFEVTAVPPARGTAG